jgi:ubiquinol-cytochrome c reductase cytochrome c1 subunit
MAAGGGIALDQFPKDKLNDMAALQNGAKLFVNYCLNCHSASYMRYNRLQDIGLKNEQIAANLIFTGGKVGDLMKAAIDPREAKEWFGATPPDLTVVARSRASGAGSGADYLYTFLRTFYRDETRPTGWNNAAFPSVGMPHVLWELQGPQQAVYENVNDGHGGTAHVFKGVEPLSAGQLSEADYNSAVGDLVAFMTWMAEPMAKDRVRIGVGVLIFLSIFFVIAWRLNASFWKDVK